MYASPGQPATGHASPQRSRAAGPPLNWSISVVRDRRGAAKRDFCGVPATPVQRKGAWKPTEPVAVPSLGQTMPVQCAFERAVVSITACSLCQHLTAASSPKTRCSSLLSGAACKIIVLEAVFGLFKFAEAYKLLSTAKSCKIAGVSSPAVRGRGRQSWYRGGCHSPPRLSRWRHEREGS